MNGNEPATKTDVAELRTELKTDLGALETRLNERHEILRSEMQHIYDALVERIADSETKVLQAFYNFADSNNKRLIQTEATDALLTSRVSTLETRVLEIE